MAKCPHCSEKVTLDSARKEIRDEIHKEVEGVLKKEVMYFCPHCDAVLGFAFFLGGMLTRRP